MVKVKELFFCSITHLFTKSFWIHFQNEIQTILNLGVAPSRIIFANPCKQKSHIRYAAEKGVALMTFDNEAELEKVKQIYPEAK